ncbi:hypothetical protein RvY_17196 [Ramazzottius varieornatus]|uniref:Uncharacterized protein n=1 Tax=Ramazzottius varieornatus TaxID=947166 RepID=A0A1D1W1C0_RAMVA|nr:hypothetical protein RvY_17196 [Ramazzottius varieornatus]
MMVVTRQNRHTITQYTEGFQFSNESEMLLEAVETRLDWAAAADFSPDSSTARTKDRSEVTQAVTLVSLSRDELSFP